MLNQLLGLWRRRGMKQHKKAGAPSGDIRLLLCDARSDIAEAWHYAFHDCDECEIWEGSLFSLDADAMVSPANSFGDIGGGIDKHIDDFYENKAQDAVMKAIRSEFFGELPVGMALVVPMQTTRFPFLLVAPTMRTPGDVSSTINAYLAFRALLVAVHKHNQNATNKPIRSIAVPGLCTGVGGMEAGIAAAQMRAARDNILGGGWKKVVHPAMAPFAFGDRSFRFRDTQE